MESVLNNTLKRLYKTPSEPSAYGGKKSLLRRARQTDPKLSEKSVDVWLSGEDAYTLHRDVKTKFSRRPTIVPGMNHQVQADLLDIRSISDFNDGFNFLLTAIDVFSKKAFVFPIRSKSALSVKQALTSLMEKHSFKTLQTDKGKEFYNREVQSLLRQKGVKHFSSENETIKAAIVERFNRTLGRKIYRFMTDRRTKRFIDVLDRLVDGYNEEHHSSIGMSPVQVNRSNQEEVWLKLYEDGARFSTTKLPKLNVGDTVRISKARGAFERGYTPNWSIEIFTVSKVQRDKRPVVYSINDYSGEPIEGTFYEEELQKVKPPSEWEIEEIIRYKGRGSRRQALVKWRGYPQSMNSWVLESDISTL